MDPGADEDLPQPARRNRLRVDLAVGAVLLIGAALVGKALADGNGSPAPTHSASASAAHSSTARPIPSGLVTVTSSPAAYLPPTAADAVKCPHRLECIRTQLVSAPVRAALTDAFPGATITAVDKVRLVVRDFGEANWSLRVDAAVGERSVVLHVRGLAQSDRTRGLSRIVFGAHAITRYEDTLDIYRVLVEVIGPAGQPQPAGPLAHLAADPRLFEPW